MLLDDSTSRHPAPPGQSRSPRRVVAIVSGIVVILLAVCVGVVTKRHFGHAAANASATSAPKVTDAKAFTPPKSWTLKFDSAFRGNQLNSRVWATCYPWATGGCT